jgi:hypothetical protein
MMPKHLGLAFAVLILCGMPGARPAQADQSSLQLEVVRTAAMKGGAAAATAQSLSQAVTTTITEHAKLTNSVGSSLGFSVSLSGNRALVGSFNSTTGAAYTFVFNGTTWTQEAILTATDGATNDAFGSSVSLSGNRALIGAPSDNGTVRPGAAFVFMFNGTNWSEEAKLTATGGSSTDYFGFSVSLQGSHALVGAFGQNSNTGAAYIFTRSGTTWSQTAALTPRTGAGGFGISVSLSGTRALIGSPTGSDGFTGSGYIFTFDGATWSQTAELRAFDGELEDNFGYSVSLSEDRALIGAPYDNSSAGSVYMFAYNGTSWGLQAHLFASDGASDDQFGTSVSLLRNGALVGAFGDDGFTGSAYLFIYDGTTWSERAKLIASDRATTDAFGMSVSLSAGRALVGAPGAGTNGAAYLFGRR